MKVRMKIDAVTESEIDIPKAEAIDSLKQAIGDCIEAGHDGEFLALARKQLAELESP